ncbi:purine-cytosine permease family protein [Effusibacillus dendaii]
MGSNEVILEHGKTGGRTHSEPKRTFNKWVNNPVLEDYSLRYAPRSFRKWSEYAVFSSAIGGIAYLADFAIGGSIAVSYGFANSFWAILVSAVIIFLTGLPIAYYSAKYNIDMDLLTRGAGFGYLGSTLTSLIYASFTFIYFALEGAVMAQAFELYFGLPLAIGYLVSSIIIIPMVIFGMTFLARLQVWTQPIWLTLMVLPFVVILVKDPGAFSNWTHFAGNSPSGASFNPMMFGLAAGVVLSLIAQIGEQVDYLRFMPEKTAKNKSKWWWAVVLAGPGWVILGAFKQWGGAFMAAYVAPAVGLQAANEPIHMYQMGFQTFIPGAFAALTIATFFVILSQIKINVTNAYSGSLSWSNFFSRLLHFHPGRVVWLFLNVGISITLMEFGLFGFLNNVLGFYSNVALAWIGAVVADLVINKAILKISPSYIEFKRAHLHNFNPVGFGSMMIASIVSILAFFNVFGPVLQAFSPFLSLLLAFVLSPILALATKGKYYIARENPYIRKGEDGKMVISLSGGSEAKAVHAALAATVDAGTVIGRKTGQSGFPKETLDMVPEILCTCCHFKYEPEDITYCPFHQGTVCSLCCSLEKDCHDMCKKQ